MEQQIPFLWTFPCYFLAIRFNKHSETGRVILDDHLVMVTPEAGPDRERMPAIFTDSHLAEKYRDSLPFSPPATILEIRRPSDFRDLLVRLAPTYRCVVVDRNPDTQICRPAYIADILAILAQAK